MAKHHKDKGGTYDLEKVHAITPIVEKNRDGEVKSTKAMLHFSGGSVIATDSDYDTTVDAWKGSPTA